MTFPHKEDLIKYRINRAKETLEEIKELAKLKYWNTCINRLYYACYYAVIGLLLKHNISATSHQGVRQMFGLHFIKTGIVSKEDGKFFSDLFDKRKKSDYDDLIDFDKKTVEPLIISAEKFIKNIEKLIELEELDIDEKLA